MPRTPVAVHAVVVHGEMVPTDGRVLHPVAAVVEALAPDGIKVCICCQHTEHDRDKNGDLWLVFDIDNTRHKCRRCDQDCCNRRCDELPANPDGRGYGKLPVRR